MSGPINKEFVFIRGTFTWKTTLFFDAMLWTCNSKSFQIINWKAVQVIFGACWWAFTEQLLQEWQKKSRTVYECIVNYTFIVPCPANERFQFHPSYMPFMSNQALNSRRQPNMLPQPPMILSNRSHCMYQTAGPLLNSNEWDSFSQFKIFSLA